MTEAAPILAAGSLPPLWRRCGRCLLDFAGDPRLDDDAQRVWWLCPPCRAALLGPPRRPPVGQPT